MGFGKEVVVKGKAELHSSVPSHFVHYRRPEVLATYERVLRDAAEMSYKDVYLKHYPEESALMASYSLIAESCKQYLHSLSSGGGVGELDIPKLLLSWDAVAAYAEDLNAYKGAEQSQGKSWVPRIVEFSNLEEWAVSRQGFVAREEDNLGLHNAKYWGVEVPLNKGRVVTAGSRLGL
jgi:hypothetical protein